MDKSIGRFFHILLVLGVTTLASGQSTGSRVEGNTFVSPENPKFRIVVDKKLAYLGRAPFAIDNIAAGNRFIFVRATSGKQVQQMFIIQQEGFLPVVGRYLQISHH